MEKIVRPEAPAWLDKQWQELGVKWEKIRKKQKDAKFRWINYLDLKTRLLNITSKHCSYCDASPLGPRLKPTIDHFKPKSKFPLLAYQWENLFISCYICQERKDRFDDGLLKPDEAYYSFDRFFHINWMNGELEPNPTALEEDKKRAKITIDLFGLNKNGKPDDRMNELNSYKKDTSMNIERFSYRFFLKRG